MKITWPPSREQLHLWVAAILLAVAFGSAVINYAVVPISRHGLSFESDTKQAAQIMAASDEGLSASSWVFGVREGKLVVASLTPALAKELASRGVTVNPMRDLPGILPIILMFGLGAANSIGLRKRLLGENIRNRVLVLIVASAAVEFYLWVWAIAADHDLTTPVIGPAQIPLRGLGLMTWRKSLLFQVPLWIVSIIVFSKFVMDHLARPVIKLFVGVYFLLLSLGVFVMFRPYPYSEYAILSWWPLLFELAVLLCGVVCVAFIHRSKVYSGEEDL